MKDDIYEVKWQAAFKRFVEGTSAFVTQNKKNIYILSLGTHNRFEGGPDFRNACMQMDGQVFVGDVEFHKKSSDWTAHHHQFDSNYSNVMLHVVFESDQPIDAPFETLIVSRAQLKGFLKAPASTPNPATTFSNEDYKYYAMLRLLRRTEEIYYHIQSASPASTLLNLLDDFLVKYNSFRVRPQSTIADFHSVSAGLQKSAPFKWLCNINRAKINITQCFDNFVNKTPELNITKHLKQEILTNVILPFGFCLAPKRVKIDLVLWYWGAKTRSPYGLLARNYPLSEQKYIWQQQGMLEHHKTFYSLQTSDAIEFLRDGQVSDYISYFELMKRPYKLPRRRSGLLASYAAATASLSVAAATTPLCNTELCCNHC